MIERHRACWWSQIWAQGGRSVAKSHLKATPAVGAEAAYQHYWKVKNSNGLRWHNFFEHSFRFRKGVLASPSRITGLWEGGDAAPFHRDAVDFRSDTSAAVGVEEPREAGVSA